ncbi:hypothetical protein FAVG1_00185 [Fusarium avenaceum]|nr:hypothetical protein FAVG1_00185 [Fusarium avenaceum]
MGIFCCKPEPPVTEEEIEEFKRERRIYFKRKYPLLLADHPDSYTTQFYAAQDLEAYRRLPSRPPWSDSNDIPMTEKPPELNETVEIEEPEPEDPEGTLVGIDVPSTATDTVTGFVAA